MKPNFPRKQAHVALERSGNSSNISLMLDVLLTCIIINYILMQSPMKEFNGAINKQVCLISDIPSLRSPSPKIGRCRNRSLESSVSVGNKFRTITLSTVPTKGYIPLLSS